MPESGKRSDSSLNLALSQARLLRAERMARFGNWELDLAEGVFSGSEGAGLIYGLSGMRWGLAEARAVPLAEYRAPLNAALRALIEHGQPYDMEFIIQRPRDGEERHIHSIAEFDPERQIVFGVIHDITERKRVEAALVESEFFFKESQRAASIGSYKTDFRLGTWESSEVLDSIFGIGPDYRRSIAGWMQLVHPDDQRMMNDHLMDDVIDRRQPFAKEYRIIRPSDQAVRWVNGLGEASFDADGQPLHLTGTIQDITGHRQAVAELARLEAQVAQNQKMETVGRLAGGIAHDINNMLAVMMAHLELMRQDLPQEPRLLRHTERMQKAAERTREMINQLLAFSRKQVVQPRPLDLNGRIAETRDALAPLLGEDIAFCFTPVPQLRQIQADPSQLDQVLLNLVVNARDAMPAGGSIRVSADNVELDATFATLHGEAQAGAYVHLQFSDDGSGIPAEVLERIFEPFFTTKEPGRGTGLGLATVYGIVQQHGGFIRVASDPGRGTSFDLYFPALEPVAQAQPAPAPAPEAWRSAGEVVLVVEDDPLLLEVLPEFITRLGYAVRVARSAEEALLLCADPDVRIDLLLTDVVMPGQSGRDLAERVLPLRPHLKVLFMSGYTAGVIADKGILDQGRNFLQKPFTLADLGRKFHDMRVGG